MRTRGIVFACVLALLAVSPAAAEKGDMQFRFGLVYSSPTDDLVSGTQKTELDSALGVGVGFEYTLTDRMGIEPGLSSTSYDLAVKETGFPDENGSTDLLAFTTNLNFHFDCKCGADFYVGPTVGYAFWGDIKLDNFAMDTPTDNDFFFGANLGVDYPFGESGWGISFGLSYYALDLPAPADDIGVSPIQVRVGAAYSF
jgi:outer membrane protein W